MILTIYREKYALLIAYFIVCCTHNLFGQLSVGSFLYPEFFYSKGESSEKVRTFYNGYNNNNYVLGYGISLSYNFKNYWRLSIDIQKNSRKFNCDCIYSVSKQDFYYVIGEKFCPLKVKSEYKFLHIPISIQYIFLNTKNINYSIGFGNTVIYQLSREDTIYNDTEFLNEHAKGRLLALISPELYAQMEMRAYKNLFYSISMGLRTEKPILSNYAFFGKIGVNYKFNISR